MYDKKISRAMRERKTMNVTLNLKSIDEAGRFAGYASVFDVVDNQRDVMLKGAFADSLKSGAGNIKLLWQHQQDEPIGVFDRIFEDNYGLYVEGRLLLDVQKGREAFTLLKSGAVNGFSIGYSPVRYKIDAQTGVRMLAEVDLWEVSLVTFPANSAASVTVVKSSPSPIGGGSGWGHSRSTAANNAPHLTSPLMGEEMIALQETLDRAIAALTF